MKIYQIPQISKQNILDMLRIYHFNNINNLNHWLVNYADGYAKRIVTLEEMNKSIEATLYEEFN